MTDKPDDDHWLARPETIHKLWLLLIAVLVLLVAAEFVFPPHPHFALDRLFGFGAWIGFGSCVVLVVVAKSLSIFNKRPDTYYDD